MEGDSLDSIIDEAMKLVSRQVGGLNVHRRTGPVSAVRDAAGLSVSVQGDYRMTLCMLADRPLLHAVTAHMARGEPEEEEQEYAAEFFNILSGRIISLYNRCRGVSARFGIPRPLPASSVPREDSARELCYDGGCGLIWLLYTPPQFGGRLQKDREDKANKGEMQHEQTNIGRR